VVLPPSGILKRIPEVAMNIAKLRLRLAGTGDEELLLNRPELTIGRALDNDLI
jgi:hypothetical protein